MAKKKKQPYEAEKRHAFQLFKKGALGKAASMYLQISNKHPEDFDTCFMLGVIARKVGNLKPAISWFARATEINNNSARAFYQLGITCRDSGNPDTAVSALRQAVSIKPDYMEAYEALTGILQTEGLYHELIETCRAAIAVMPDTAELYARLAGACEQTSQLNEAEQAAKLALQYDSGHTRALFTLAKIARRKGDLNTAQDQLNSLLAMQLSPAQFSAVAGELGEVLDRLGDFDNAFKTFERANEALLANISSHMLQHNPVLINITRYRRFFTEQAVSTWAGEEPDDGLDSPLFLVGFPRSGTTLTEQILTTTNKIQPSDEQMIVLRLIEELPELLSRPIPYPECLSGISQEELRILRSRYWTLAEELCGTIEKNKRFLDKLPLNIIDLGFIYRIFPRTSVVVMLRDPRDCCLSGFMRQFVLNEAMVNLTSLAQAGKFYAEVMGLWLHYRENLPIKYKQLCYEDLIGDQEGTSRALIEFAGLEWNEEVLRFYEKARERNVRTPSYSAIATPIYKRAAGRWKNYAKQIASITDHLEPYIKEFGYEWH